MTVRGRSGTVLLAANAALVCANALFGAGSVVSQVTLSGVNPAFFSLIRESVAGPVLLLLASCTGGARVNWAQDWWRFLLTGAGIFVDQFCYMIGVKVGGSMTGSLWQPVTPVMIVILAVALHYEHLSWAKSLGILLAAAGCAFYSLFDAESGGSSQSAGDVLKGSLIMFIQCLGASSEVILQKPLLQRGYKPLVVLSWSYLIATIPMAIAVATINSSATLVDFVCPDCQGNGWQITREAWIGIAYWIVGASMCAYYLQVWGNKHVDASLVGAYTVVQPIVATIVGIVTICATPAPHFGLHGLDAGEFGAIGIFIGLALVVYDNRAHGQAIAIEPIPDANKLVSCGPEDAI